MKHLKSTLLGLSLSIAALASVQAAPAAHRVFVINDSPQRFLRVEVQSTGAAQVANQQALKTMKLGSRHSHHRYHSDSVMWQPQAGQEALQFKVSNCTLKFNGTLTVTEDPTDGHLVLNDSAFDAAKFDGTVNLKPLGPDGVYELHLRSNSTAHYDASCNKEAN
jgi:hypothetical protein